MSVFGGDAGFTEGWGRSRWSLRRLKFWIPMNKDKRLGTSPGRLMLLSLADHRKHGIDFFLRQGA